MFVLRFVVECISWLGTDFPFGQFRKVEFIRWNVVWPFGSLLPVAVDKCHFLRNELFGFCVSSGCSERELGGGGFGGILDFPEAGINFGVGELDEILVSIDFFFLLLW